MGNMLTWAQRARIIDGITDVHIKSTTEKYSQIKDMDLETVKWGSYYSSNLMPALFEVKEFIKQNNPCLFIYDPRISELKKNAIFDVADIDTVYLWINKNFNDVKNYDYLITSQIKNPGDGFVGSVVSDGKGRLVCETLHTPTICNHRELSQNTKEFPEGSFNELYLETDGVHELWSVVGKHLTRRDILEIQELYMHRNGYFEFVKGVQAGSKGMYTIGYESQGAFDLQDLWHKSGCYELTPRLNGTLLREGMR
jgi:hypothetical protein